MGSEGRWEQTFRTDQDNAIIYQVPDNDEQADRVADYFQTLGEKAIEHLVECGYPRCPGNIMASNPQWRLTTAGWQQTFYRWLQTPDPQEVLNSTIFFDFRAGFGNSELVRDLRNNLARQAEKQDIFLLHLAKDCLTIRPPLSFFKNFIVEKNGEHKNTLDLKRSGLTPFVDFARVMSLRYGVRESNT